MYTFEDFKISESIGEGGYGQIYSAKYKNGKDVCLKVIDIGKMKLNYNNNELKNCDKDLNTEIEILKLLNEYENSVHYYGNFDRVNDKKQNEKIIIMEKCDKNLMEFIRDKGRALSDKEIKKKFMDLNEVFEFMQKKKIIHRDLKVQNFLVIIKKDLKNDYVIKLSDYGLGKIKEKSNSLFSGKKGTYDTLAPEILLDKIQKYDSKIDIFSLGIILYQISNPPDIKGKNITFRHPFTNHDFTRMTIYSENYENDSYDVEFDKSITNESFKDLVRKMIKLNPNNRITWNDYFNHEFFQVKPYIIPINCKSVISMNSMFCDSSITSVDLSSSDTINIKDMSKMFYNCKNLREIKFSKSFITQNVKNMSFMFFGCRNLKYLDLSFFDTRNVDDMTGMFYNCRKLQLSDLSFLKIKEQTSIKGMFYNCKNLENLLSENKKIFHDYNSIKEDISKSDNLSDSFSLDNNSTNF